MKTVMVPDIFGGDTPMPKPGNSPYKNFRMYNNYRRAYEDCNGQMKNCGNCRYSIQHMPGATRYRKCDLMGVSHSSATDVSNRKVCNKHESRQ